MRITSGGYMLELAALLSVYTSFALAYAANPTRLPERWLLRPSRAWGYSLRWMALTAVVLAVVLWSRTKHADGGLVLLSGLMAVTTLFILLISVWPRGMLALGMVAPPIIACLSVLAIAYE